MNKALRQFAFENCDHTKTEPGISKLKTPAEYFWDIEMLLGSAEVGVENLQKLKDTEISNPVQRLDHFNYRTSYEKDALLQVILRNSLNVFFYLHLTYETLSRTDACSVSTE